MNIKNILYVDSDTNWVNQFSQMLQMGGMANYKVDNATNLVEAMNKINSGSNLYNAAIFNYNVLGQRGNAQGLVQNIKKVAPFLKILFTLDNNDPYRYVDISKSDANGILIKPFSLDAFMAEFNKQDSIKSISKNAFEDIKINNLTEMGMPSQEPISEMNTNGGVNMNNGYNPNMNNGFNSDINNNFNPNMNPQMGNTPQGQGFNPNMGVNPQMGGMPQGQGFNPQMGGMNQNPNMGGMPQGQGFNPNMGGNPQMAGMPQGQGFNPNMNDNPQMGGMPQGQGFNPQMAGMNQNPNMGGMPQGQGFNPQMGVNPNMGGGFNPQMGGMSQGQGFNPNMGGNPQMGGMPPMGGMQGRGGVLRIPKNTTIATHCPKGGVGKSSISKELAVTYAKSQVNGERLKVCLVDMDIDYGDIAVMLELKQNKSIADWVRNIRQRKQQFGETNIQYSYDELDKFYLLTHRSGLKVLAAPTNHRDAAMVNEEMVSIIINNLKNLFDIVIIDTGNNIKDFTVTSMEQADKVLMVCNSDVMTINEILALKKTLEQIQFPMSKISLLMNEVKKDEENDAREIATYLGLPLIGQLPKIAAIEKSNNAGDALSMSDKDNAFTFSLKTIANQMVPVVKKPQMEGKSRGGEKKGLFSKLFGK